MNPKISVITVTYNSSKFIKEMLLSVEQQTKTSHEVIVVDNNSQDDTLDQIRQSSIKVKLLPQSKNLGFSEANNVGVAKSIGEYLMFLNPDTQVLDDALDKLYYCLMDHKDFGVVAPKLVEDNGQAQLSVRKDPTILGAIREYYLRIKNSYEPFAPNGSRPVGVDNVVGAAMMIPRKIYLKVGGFDEKFFMYYEDIDLCKKIKQLGYKIIYLPKVKVKHSVGVSSKTNPKTAGYLKRSAFIYHGAINYFLLQLVLKLRRFSPFSN